MTQLKAENLTRDWRMAILTFQNYGLTIKAIADQLDLSRKQDQRACYREGVSDN